jgi:hypothetical protein
MAIFAGFGSVWSRFSGCVQLAPTTQFCSKKHPHDLRFLLDLSSLRSVVVQTDFSPMASKLLFFAVVLLLGASSLPPHFLRF